MTIEEYFNGWYPYVEKHLNTTLQHINKEYETWVCVPEKNNIFLPFHLCPKDTCRAIVIGEKPSVYSHGLSFANCNDKEFKLIMLKSVGTTIDYADRVYSFAKLEQLARQGILMLNQTLTINKYQDHVFHWSKFMTNFLQLYTKDVKGLSVSLIGDARILRSVIHKGNTIYEYDKVTKEVFLKINKHLAKLNGEEFTISLDNCSSNLSN